MTTSKQRLTVYLRNGSELEALREALRVLAPLDARGFISRSTVIEAAIGCALRDIEARGRDSDVFKALVTLPVVTT